MSIDFTLSPEVQDVRNRVRKFMDEEVRPTEQKLRDGETDRNGYIGAIVGLRQRAHELGLWNPHLPSEWDGMGLGPVTAALQGMTPPRLRARAAALLYLFVNLIAFAGVPAASVLNESVFGRPETLNYALAVIAVAFGGLALAVVLWGLPHYRRLLAREAVAG